VPARTDFVDDAPARDPGEVFMKTQHKIVAHLERFLATHRLSEFERLDIEARLARERHRLMDFERDGMNSEAA
jgi:hypothetical protein